MDLTFSDLCFNEHFFALNIKHSKTDKFRKGV